MDRQAAAALRIALLSRLERENETDLADRLRRCGIPGVLVCCSCGHRHATETRCKNKWCPSCVQSLAAERSKRINFAVSRFKWPLFITLTMGNVDDLEADPVRQLRRAFGKLRARKFWKETVRGGVASIEVTNIGNGWHPHLHAVIDCQWLSILTTAPRRHNSAAEIEHKIKAAGGELQEAWRQCLKQGPDPVIKVKRASAGITTEVVKYSIKGTDLVSSPDPIGPLIRCLQLTRLLTTFGSCYRLASIMEQEESPAPFLCPNGHSDWSPADHVSGQLSKARDEWRSGKSGESVRLRKINAAAREVAEKKRQASLRRLEKSDAARPLADRKLPVAPTRPRGNR